MKNNQIIFLLFVSIAIFLNSCACYFGAKRYMSYHYDGQYTGIDSMINVDGYYTSSIIGETSSVNSFSFYRDGTLRLGFSSKKILNSIEKAADGSYKFNKDRFLLPFENDSLLFGDWYNPGLYKINNDTITTQVAFEHSSTRVFYYLVWFKILSREKLLVIKYEGINNDCEYCDKYLNQELVFYPAWRPDSTDNWLRDCLREKGAR